MAERDPRNTVGSRWAARDWSWSKLLLLILGLAAFITMLTWDRGHFPQEQQKKVEQPGSK